MFNNSNMSQHIQCDIYWFIFFHLNKTKSHFMGFLAFRRSIFAAEFERGFSCQNPKKHAVSCWFLAHAACRHEPRHEPLHVTRPIPRPVGPAPRTRLGRRVVGRRPPAAGLWLVGGGTNHARPTRRRAGAHQDMVVASRRQSDSLRFTPRVSVTVGDGAGYLRTKI